MELVVDLCSGGSLDGLGVLEKPEKFTSCKISARLPPEAQHFTSSQPLQVGGIAHPPPSRHTHGWPIDVVSNSLDGCIRNIRINGEVSHFCFLISANDIFKKYTFFSL